MKVTIHDVGHGLCVSLIHDNGNVMLWDCGHSESFHPAEFLVNAGIRCIDYLLITNYDEDHISDLPNIRKCLPVSLLVRNKSISAEQLRALKLRTSPISHAMKCMLHMMASYNSSPSVLPEFPGVKYRVFYNSYGVDFNDTNNISLVTFLKFGESSLIIPGDLEVPGWEKLLQTSDFREELQHVDCFLASHHGRENGYCAEVFDYCSPKVVIFSDSNIKYATQEMAEIYSRHASGIMFNGEQRYVLTTRKDGSLCWNI